MTDDRWVSYFDLAGLGFINPQTGKAFSRKHLGDLMRRGEWPKAIQVSPNRIAWRLSQLREREATLPVARSLQAEPPVTGSGKFTRRAPVPASTSGR